MRISKLVFSAIITLIIATNSYALSSRTCNPNVPKTIKYRPSLTQCGGNAAVILSGKYLNPYPRTPAN